MGDVDEASIATVAGSMTDRHSTPARGQVLFSEVVLAALQVECLERTDGCFGVLFQCGAEVSVVPKIQGVLSPMLSALWLAGSCSLKTLPLEARTVSLDCRVGCPRLLVVDVCCMLQLRVATQTLLRLFGFIASFQHAQVPSVFERSSRERTGSTAIC